MKELIVSLDLEFNQPSGRIIQIGAVIGSVKAGEVISSFDRRVNPGEPLSERIVALTGICDRELEAAPDIYMAGRDLAVWLSEWNSLRLLNPLTWGGGDTESLREQLGATDER